MDPTKTEQQVIKPGCNKDMDHVAAASRDREQEAVYSWQN